MAYKYLSHIYGEDNNVLRRFYVEEGDELILESRYACLKIIYGENYNESNVYLSNAAKVKDLREKICRSLRYSECRIWSLNPLAMPMSRFELISQQDHEVFMEGCEILSNN